MTFFGWVSFASTSSTGNFLMSLENLEINAQRNCLASGRSRKSGSYNSNETFQELCELMGEDVSKWDEQDED